MRGFAYQDYNGTQLLCHQLLDEQWKIIIPEAVLINDTIHWYHAIMGHVDSSHLMTLCAPLSGLLACVDALILTVIHGTILSITRIKAMAKVHSPQEKMFLYHLRKSMPILLAPDPLTSMARLFISKLWQLWTLPLHLPK
jgi:hypothetical protein